MWAKYELKRLVTPRVVPSLEEDNKRIMKHFKSAMILSIIINDLQQDVLDITYVLFI